jgi:hypothetical protein
MVETSDVETPRKLRARRSRRSSSYSSGSRRSRSSRVRVSRGSRRTRIVVRKRSNYYRGSTLVIRFSKPTASICSNNWDCRSKCCKRNKMRKTKISPSLKVYNRYYGKKTLIVKYRKKY